MPFENKSCVKDIQLTVVFFSQKLFVGIVLFLGCYKPHLLEFDTL